MLDKEFDKPQLYIKIGSAVLAFGPPRKIDFHTRRDVAMHAHSVFEFHLLYGGEAVIETEQNRYALRAGNVALIPPTIYHFIKNVTDSFALRSFSFSLSIAEDKHGSAQLDISQLFEYILRKDAIILEGPTTIMWIAEHLCDEVSNDTQPGSRHLQEAYATALLVMLLRKFFSEQQFSALTMACPKPTSSFIDPERASKIEMYCADNYIHGSVRQLARTLGLSEQHVRRILLAHYGMPFLQIINKHRINVSKKLLRETELAISEIWKSVGFNTPQSFNNAFRKYAECTPTQYRKQHQHSAPFNRQ